MWLRDLLWGAVPDEEGEAAIRAQDPDPEQERIVTMVKQGMESPFWHWYRQAVQQESQADILALADPNTKAEAVGFLRGKIRARNEDLLLPLDFVRMYDGQYGTEAEAPVQDTPGQPRRLSPVKEDWNAGHPGQRSEGGHPASDD